MNYNRLYLILHLNNKSVHTHIQAKQIAEEFDATSLPVWINVHLQASPLFAGANMEETHFEIGQLANILLM